MAVMFPFSERELERRARAESSEPKRKPWTRRGFFKNYKPMSRREVAMKANNARMWLEYTLRKPMLAREVLKLAAQEGLSEAGVRRAKRHHGIKTIRAGGKGSGRRNPWVWMFPEADVAN